MLQKRKLRLSVLIKANGWQSDSDFTYVRLLSGSFS